MKNMSEAFEPLATLFTKDFRFGEKREPVDLVGQTDLRDVRREIRIEDLSRALRDMPDDVEGMESLVNDLGISPETITVDDDGVNLPIGYGLIVLEDEQELREQLVEKLTEEITPRAFSEMGLEGMRTIPVLGFESVHQALEAFAKDPYPTTVFGAIIDLNLAKARDESKAKFAMRVATSQVENIPAWRSAIPVLRAGGYDAWRDSAIAERIPEAMKLYGSKGGIVAATELYNAGVKLMITDINSSEGPRVRHAAMKPLLQAAYSGAFPLPTVNEKTPGDPELDAENLSQHLLVAGKDLLSALNDPELIDLYRSGKCEDSIEYAVRAREKVGGVLRTLVEEHKKARHPLTLGEGHKQARHPGTQVGFQLTALPDRYAPQETYEFNNDL